MINVKNYDLVTPGTLLSDENGGSYGTYTEENRVFSKFFGMVQIGSKGISVNPLSGVYFPEEGDEVVGKVIEVGSKYWVVDIDAPFSTRLDVRDVNFRVDMGELDKFIDMGDLIYARVSRVYTNRAADLSMRGSVYGKLPSDMIKKIDPVKLPRLIGKEGNMVNLIKEKTKCDMIIGQNGVVWIDGKDEDAALASMAVDFVDKHYSEQDLTEKVMRLFEDVRRKI